jgi:hypothetical protein
VVRQTAQWPRRRQTRTLPPSAARPSTEKRYIIINCDSIIPQISRNDGRYVTTRLEFDMHSIVQVITAFVYIIYFKMYIAWRWVTYETMGRPLTRRLHSYSSASICTQGLGNCGSLSKLFIDISIAGKVRQKVKRESIAFSETKSWFNHYCFWNISYRRSKTDNFYVNFTTKNLLTKKSNRTTW